MKNDKKVFYKNRVKCFYTDPVKSIKNRLKVNKKNSIPEQGSDKEKEAPQNTEEQGDSS